MSDWALITGASSGIGLELAKLFAADRFNLALVARNESRLNQLAESLRREHGIETRVLARDLSAAGAPREIFDALHDTPISVLVNNAGIGFYGAFAKSDLREQTGILQVNITALTQLTHLFLQPMLARKAGRILNVASTAAFQPGPMVNVYYASKAFVYSFSYALSVELEKSGVTVTALCPGTTHTEFFSRGHFGSKRAPFTMDARTVAEIGYRGLMKGRRVVIPGIFNRVTSALSKRMPARFTTAIVKRVHGS
ncbi:MAG TPA: SDR family oxidoreductase [Verrucomicrobiae bacterium]|nr:SDR family oxidoreductase [Verrucomicrobiae bacterium]